MKNHVFYSWQSDLENRYNRSFIESCIKKALKELNTTMTFDIEFCIDRDTMNESGTPDIANTIFSKIDKSKIFIADVSIINSNCEGRKTPNPNVLIELGYAAKVLGWDRIICVFNTDYGSFEDLPFDIKFRRPLCYGLKNKNKIEVQKIIVQAIKNSISLVDSKGLISANEVGSYLVLETSEFYNLLQINVEKVLSDSKIQKKYGFTNASYFVEIWDDLLHRIDNGEPTEDTDIQHFISIEFTDDVYSYKDIKDRNCSISFELCEKFKQINFSNHKVYSAFEIISQGYSPSEKRNYKELADEIIKKI